MKIKKIEASSLQEAVEEVKKVYGKDAMILSSKVIKKNIIPGYGQGKNKGIYRCNN